MSATEAEVVSIRDPYEVLGVEKSATEDQIKSAYKKCALKYHPDKNRGDGAEEAENKFKEVVTAFNILSDPDKRRRYDAGGFENLEASDLSVELDLSSMGWGNTMVAAMFSKLGVPIKTTVSQGVLDVAASGSMPITRLDFGQHVKGKVDKQEAVFFEVEVTEQDLQEGFYIFANSPIGSKFKLLHFDRSEAGGLQLNLQEDSTKMGKAHTTAGLFFLPFETYSLGPKVNPMDLAEDPEAALFRRLESFRPRETCALSPGVHTFAVYGDNWFKRGQYQLEAVRAQQPATWGNALTMRDIEAKISSRKEEIKKFEKDFRRIQSEYLAACEKFTSTSEELEDLLRSREEAYLALFESEDAGAAQGGGGRGGVLFFGGGSGASSSNNGGNQKGSPDQQQADNGNGGPKKDKSPLGLPFRLFSGSKKKPGDEAPKS